MKRLILSIILICFFPLAEIGAETLTFVTGGISPPYIYTDQNIIKGMDKDVVEIFCEQNNMKSEFKDYPWKRALKMAQRGEADGILSLFRTSERENYFYYPSIPINSVKTVIIAQKKNNIKLSRLNDLRDKTIGMVMGYKYGPKFDNFNEIIKAPCKDKHQLIQMLDRDRLKMIVDSESVFKFMCRKYQFDLKKFEVIYVIRENPIYVAFSKKALNKKGEILARRFDNFFKKIKENGELEKVRGKYISASFAQLFPKELTILK